MICTDRDFADGNAPLYSLVKKTFKFMGEFPIRIGPLRKFSGAAGRRKFSFGVCDGHGNGIGCQMTAPESRASASVISLRTRRALS